MIKKNLFILQPKIQHYRIPVFELLKTKLQEEYNISVFGLTDNGKAFNGEKKSYFNNEYYLRFFGIEFWPFIIFKILKKKPDLIIATTSPRNLISWVLPFICQTLNIKLIGWSKINSISENYCKFIQYFKKSLYSKYKFLIVYGQKSAQEFKSFRLKNNEITIANNTIDTVYIRKNKQEITHNSKLIKQKYNIKKNEKIYISIGRFIEEKRQIDILNAWYYSNLKNSKAKLFFVGNGPTFNFIKKSEKAKLQNVYFVGSVDYKFDYAWLNISNVAIFGGAIGLACQQAMALNTFVIACKENGTDSEILVHKDNCLLYKKNDVNKLSNIFNTLEINNSFYKKIIKKAEFEVFNNYSLENMVSKIYDIITKS